MRTEGVLKKIYSVKSFAALFSLLLLRGVWALVDSDWVTAAQSFAMVAVFSVFFREERGMTSARAARQNRLLTLGSGLAFLGIAIADGLAGRVGFAAMSGFSGVALILSLDIDRRSRRARRAPDPDRRLDQFS